MMPRTSLSPYSSAPISSVKGCQRLAEIPRGDAFEVKPRQQFLHRLGLAQIWRNKRGVETDLRTIRVRPTVAHARNLNRYLANPGQNFAFRQKVVFIQDFVTAKRSASEYPGQSNAAAAQCTNTRLNAFDGVSPMGPCSSI